MPSRLHSEVILPAWFRFSPPILSPRFHIFEGEFFEEPLLGHVSLMDRRPRRGFRFTHTLPHGLAG
jgi:hypothetical protein